MEYGFLSLPLTLPVAFIISLFCPHISLYSYYGITSLMSQKPSCTSKPSQKQAMIDLQKEELKSAKNATARATNARKLPLAFKLSSAAAADRLEAGNPFAPPPAAKSALPTPVDDVVTKKLMEKQARKLAAAKKEAEREAGDASTLFAQYLKHI